MDMSGARNVSGRRPDHWIGIEADYRSREGHPSQYLYSLSRRDLATHALLLGKTGSGKTVCLTHFVAGAILRTESFVLVDARGDQVNDVLTLLAGRVEPERVKIIDLRDSSPHMGFDPLRGSSVPHKRALNVLETIRAMSDGWGVQLDETLRNILIALAETDEPLTEVERMLYDASYRRIILRGNLSESVRAFLERFDAMREDRQASLAMPVMNKISSLFATRKLRAILRDQNPINLQAHLECPGNIVLVSLAIDETAAVGRAFGSMFLGCLTQTMFSRVDEPEHRRNPVLLFLDEFSHFAGEDIDVILAEGRRFGFSAVLAHQTLSQVPPSLRSMVLGNVGAKLIFRLGRDDAETMSADLTGDRKAIDFTKLRVGTCVAAKADGSLAGVEINTRIGNGGALEADALDFRDQVHEEHPNFESPEQVLRALSQSLEASQKVQVHEEGAKERGRQKAASRSGTQEGISLEEWL